MCWAQEVGQGEREIARDEVRKIGATRKAIEAMGSQ